MPKYTTGEIAALCGVSVRTVQYYDSRNILIPGQLSEGGRRLYSEEDVQKLKIICFLRGVGLSINNIAELLEDDDPGSVISILLSQQEEVLARELAECSEKLDMVKQIKKELKNMDNFSVGTIGDIAHIMKNRKRMYRIRAAMLLAGLVGEVLETASLIYGIISGVWWPYLAGLPIVAAIAVWISVFYFKKVDYICPECHVVFKPRFKEMLFAAHTPTTRKLTCVRCGHKGFCVETCTEKENNNG